MNIHEYQGKQLLKSLRRAGRRRRCRSSRPSEAEAAAKKLPGPLYVVKSQIHAGGRGKGKFKELRPDAKGGVRLAKSVDEVVANVNEMLGNTLVTKQTGPAGKQVNRLYIEDGADIERELYLSILVDRSVGRVAFVVSTEGGMDIEAVAHDTPEKIVTVAIDPENGRDRGRRAEAQRGAEARRRRGEGRRDAVPAALQGLRREGHEPARGQPADRHEERPSARARREGVVRQQRAVPPSRYRGTARHDRGGREGDRGVEIRPRLCRARRQYRLHGQRRRPCHGDDGHHQALRRRAGQLPRRRRRRVEGEGHGGVQDHHRRSRR